jgi:hypothetical protein
LTKVTKKEVRAAKSLPDEYLYCRTVGHRWDRTDDYDIPVPKLRWGTPVCFCCQGCGMHRIDVIDRRGLVSYRIYKQPEGYKIKKDSTPKRSTLRLEFLRRT